MKKIYITPEVNIEQYELEQGIACITTSIIGNVPPYSLGGSIKEVSPTNCSGKWVNEDNL